MRYAPLSMGRAQQGSPRAPQAMSPVQPQIPAGAFDPSKPARGERMTDAQREWERSSGDLSRWLSRNLYSVETPEWNMDGGNPPPAVSKTWMLDPWTNKFVPVGAGVNTTTEYGPGDTERTVHLPGDPPIERIMQRGAPGDALQDVAHVRSLLSPEKQAEFDELYGQTQAAWQPFSEQNLPPALREQVSRFIPEDTSGLKGFMANRDYGVNRLTSSLASRGITDLSQLGVARGADGKPVIYDPRTGESINPGLLTFKGGRHDGNLQYSLRPNAQGTGLTLGTHFERPETRGIDIIDAAIPAIILGTAAGPAGAALGTAMGGTAGAMLGGKIAAGALSGGLGAAMQGGNVGQGMLSGGFGAGLGGMGNLGGNLLGSGAPAWQQAMVNQGVGGALSSGLRAGLSGGNVGQELLTGGLGGAIGGGLSAYGNSLFQGQNPLMQGLGRIGTSAVTGGVQGVLRGQGFGQGAQRGALGGLQGVASAGLGQYARQLGLSPELSRTLGGFGGRMLTAPLVRG